MVAASVLFAPVQRSRCGRQIAVDIGYYPANYPVLKIQDKASEPLVARVVYSRPKRKTGPFRRFWLNMENLEAGRE